MLKSMSLLIVLPLAACGTLAENADTPSGVYAGLEARAAVPDDAAVQVVSSGPQVGAGGVEVQGVSCKNKIWSDPPSRDNAIALMKRQAAEKGMNAVYAVEAKDDPAALAKNCWSAIVATGIAFRAEPAPRR